MPVASMRQMRWLQPHWHSPSPSPSRVKKKSIYFTSIADDQYSFILRWSQKSQFSALEPREHAPWKPGLICSYALATDMRKFDIQFCFFTVAKYVCCVCIDLKASTEELCNTPGCTKRKYNKGDGMTFDYCSIYCRDNKQKDG